MSILLLGCESGAAAWTPGDLPGVSPALLIRDHRAAGLLWQDVGETVPAADDTDPIRVDAADGGDYTAPSSAARLELYDEGDGLWSAVTDGVDDQFATPLATWAGEFTLYWAGVGVGGKLPIVGNNTAFVGWYGGGSNFLVLTDTEAGAEASAARPNGPLIIRVRRDASDVVYLRIGDGAESSLGVIAGAITPGNALRGREHLAASGMRTAALIPVAGPVSAGDDALAMTYLAGLLPA